MSNDMRDWMQDEVNEYRSVKALLSEFFEILDDDSDIMINLDVENQDSKRIIEIVEELKELSQ